MRFLPQNHKATKSKKTGQISQEGSHWLGIFLLITGGFVVAPAALGEQVSLFHSTNTLSPIHLAALGDRTELVRERVKKRAQQTTSKVKEGATNLGSKVKEGATNLGPKVKEGATNLGNQVKAGGSNLFNNVTEGCSSKSDPRGCPFTGPRGKEIFSRCMGPLGLLTSNPTIRGNVACNAVLGVQKLPNKLDKARDKAKSRIDKRIDGITEGLMDSKLLQTLAVVKEISDDIKRDIVDFTNDPECGREDMYDHANNFYRSKVENAKTFAVLMTKRLKVAKETSLAIAEARKGKKALDNFLPCVDTKDLVKAPGKVGKALFKKLKKDDKEEPETYTPPKTNLTTGISSGSDSESALNDDSDSEKKNGSNDDTDSEKKNGSNDDTGSEKKKVSNDDTDSEKKKASNDDTDSEKKKASNDDADSKKKKPSKKKRGIAKKVAACSGELAQRTHVPDHVNDFAGSILGVTPPFASGQSEETELIAPFLYKCYGCAKGLKNAAKGIWNGAMAVTTASACATGVGCVVPAVKATMTAVKLAQGAVRAGVSCTRTVKSGVENWDGYKARWAELAGFFGGVRENGFSSKRLVDTFKGMPAELDGWKNEQVAEEKAKAITVVNHFKKSYRHIKIAESIRKNEVVPLKNKLGEMRLATFEKNFFKLKTCWGKVQKLRHAMTEDVAEGLKEISVVLVDFEAVEKDIADIKLAGENARQAAQDRRDKRRERLKRNIGELHYDLLGVSVGKPPRATTTGRHLAKKLKGGGINSLNSRLTNLSESIDRIDGDTTNNFEGLEDRAAAVRKKVEMIRSRLQRALGKLKKGRSKGVVTAS